MDLFPLLSYNKHIKITIEIAIMTTIKSISFVVFLALLMYLSCSFVYAEFNPFVWSEATRYWFCLSWLIVGIIGTIIIFIFNDDNDDGEYYNIDSF